jgi:hypothetical protein
MIMLTVLTEFNAVASLKLLMPTGDPDDVRVS